MKKEKKNQDELRVYMTNHDMTVKRLGELIGMSDSAMSNALNHFKVNGKPYYFPLAKLQAINEALPQMADEIEARVMEFNPANNPSKVNGHVYDPACVEQLRRVGDYFKVKRLTERILHWTNAKNNSVFAPASTSKGYIKKEEVLALNEELRAVANELRNTEVVPMDYCNSESSADSE